MGRVAAAMLQTGNFLPASGFIKGITPGQVIEVDKKEISPK